MEITLQAGENALPTRTVINAVVCSVIAAWHRVWYALLVCVATARGVDWLSVMAL